MGAAAPVVAHAPVAYAHGLYAEPHGHEEIAAEPYVHEEIAAEAYVHEEIPAEAYVDVQVPAEAYVHAEPAPVAHPAYAYAAAPAYTGYNFGYAPVAHV